MPTGTLLLRVTDPISLWQWGDSPTVDEKTGDIGDEHVLKGGTVNVVESPSSGFLTAIADAVDAGVLSVVDKHTGSEEDEDGHLVAVEHETTPELAKHVAEHVAQRAAETERFLAAFDKERSAKWNEHADEFGVITDEGRDAVDEHLHKVAPDLLRKARSK